MIKECELKVENKGVGEAQGWEPLFPHIHPHISLSLYLSIHLSLYLYTPLHCSPASLNVSPVPPHRTGRQPPPFSQEYWSVVNHPINITTAKQVISGKPGPILKPVSLNNEGRCDWGAECCYMTAGWAALPRRRCRPLAQPHVIMADQCHSCSVRYSREGPLHINGFT